MVGDRYPNELVRFIFPDKNIELQEKYEQEKVVIDYQVADINFWINDGGVRKLLNIEPYSKWEKSVPAEVFTRNAIITKGMAYKHEVISVVLLLSKKQRKGKYEVTMAGETVNYYKFPIVNLADIEKILKEYPPLAPFVLKVDRSYQDRVLEVVKGDVLLSCVTVLVLNNLGMSHEEALAMTGIKLKEFEDALLQVPIMQHVAKDWKREGKEIGKKEEKEAIAKSMLRENMEAAMIAKITGLKREEIEKLRENKENKRK